MSKYAKGTSVSSDRSRAEIERTLKRYGATGFAYGWDGDRVMICFDMASWRVKFILGMPERSLFAHTPGRGRPRKPEDIERHWEQACRESWRALNLVIKAKLEAVESGITCFEDEFLAHIVLFNGQTVSGWLLPQLEESRTGRTLPPLLPGVEPVAT